VGLHGNLATGRDLQRAGLKKKCSTKEPASVFDGEDMKRALVEAVRAGSIRASDLFV